ncbi:MAG: ribonuclease III [Caulobacteraceae bacterium]
MNTRTSAVAELEQRLGYALRDRDLLERALTHSSVGDGTRKSGDNERLEFLGDRVLGLLTAERLIELDPKASEGDLAPRLNSLVNRQACARVARRMGLGAAMRLSGAESKTGGRDKDSILADCCEAIIAALYIDGGLDVVRTAYLSIWADEFEQMNEPRPKDAKTLLQEWSQGRGLPLPAYSVVKRSGPDHAPSFDVEVNVQTFPPALGSGLSRQSAEKAAAQVFVDRESVR